MAVVNESPLWALIAAEMERHGYTYRDVEQHSSGQITKGDLGFWKNNTNKLISPPKLISLAGVLQVSLERIVDAALATSGLDAGRPQSVEDAIRADRDLSEISKRRLIRAVEQERIAAEEVPEAALERNPGGTPAGQSEESHR